MRKLFLLEDDLSLISGLTFAFKKQGFALDTARTLAEAEVLWSDRKYDLLVLDVSLPDGSGFDFCQKVRRTSNVPILFLTASDEEMNIIMGLELGGDDYLTKPFRVAELRARVAAHLRRQNRTPSHKITRGGVTLDLSAKEAGVGSTPLHLTKSEYAICELLALHAGQTFSKEQIYEAVFGYDGTADDTAITQHIKNIRAKLRGRHRKIIRKAKMCTMGFIYDQWYAMIMCSLRDPRHI